MALRIAYLTLQATTEGQAAHAHVNEIVKGLRAEGHTVELYAPDYATGAAPGVFARIREFRRLQSRLLRESDSFDAAYVRAHPLAYQAAGGLRDRSVPVVQECNGVYEDLFLAWPAARPFRAPLVALARRQYREADARIAVTPELAAWLTAETGRPAEVVGNGADTDLFNPAAERPPGLPERYVVFFGALAPWQGIATTLEATQDPDWPDSVRLVIVGDGALRDEVVAAAQRSPHRVAYLGTRPYAEIPGIVAGAIASIIAKNQPEHAASGLSPLKLYESMACGVPVVASNTPGLAETVAAHECGLTVPPGDAAAIARAVAQLVGEPEVAAAMGARGREAAVARYSWRARAATTARIIERAVAARSPR